MLINVGGGKNTETEDVTVDSVVMHILYRLLSLQNADVKQSSQICCLATLTVHLNGSFSIVQLKREKIFVSLVNVIFNYRLLVHCITQLTQAGKKKCDSE